MKSIFFLFFSFIVSTQALAQQRIVVQPDTAFAARLTELEQSADLTSLFRAAAIPKTREELKSALDWMHSRAILGKSRDPRYLLSYASLLYLARIRDTAAAAYLSGVLIGRIEAARCADASAPSGKIRKIEAETAFLQQMYWSFPREQRMDFLDYATLLEQGKPLGKPNAWLCSGGMRDTRVALEKAVAAGDSSGITERTNNNMKEIVIDTSGVTPAFLDDLASAPVRQKVIESFKKYFSAENSGNQAPGTNPNLNR